MAKQQVKINSVKQQALINSYDRINPNSLVLIQSVMKNIALSSFLFGYLMSYFNSIDFDSIVNILNLHIERSLGQGLLTGCIPISACIGALMSSLFLKHFTRVGCFYTSNVACIIATLFIQTKAFYLIFIGRIIQGAFIGLISSIAPLYIKQFVPQMNGKYGLYHQFSITAGIVGGFLINLVLHKVLQKPQYYWRFLFGLPILVCFFQIYQLRTRYTFQTPRYLISQNRNEQALQLLTILYKKEYVELEFKILREAVKHNSNIKQIAKIDQNYEMYDLSQQKSTKKQQFQLSQYKSTEKQQLNLKLLQVEEQVLKQQSSLNSKLAIFAAFHLSFMQQIIGIGAIIVYSGDIIKPLFPSLSEIFPVLVHSFGMLATYLGLNLLKTYGRVFLMQLGSIVMAIFLLIIGYNFLQQEESNGYIVTLSILIMRGTFSFTLGPIVWLYMAEIIKPNIMPYGSMINWLGATLVMFTFPIFQEYLGNPGWIFIFNGLYCGLSAILNHFILVQSKDRNQLTISKMYDQKLQTLKNKFCR